MVSVFTGGHLAFVDYLLMDRMPVLLIAWFCGMNIHTYLAFVCTYLYMASHAHCGFEHPLDPMQWLTCGNRYHDTHHKLTWTGYQVIFFIRRSARHPMTDSLLCVKSFFNYLDKLFGTDPESYAARKNKPNHEIVKQSDDEFKPVEVMGG